MSDTIYYNAEGIAVPSDSLPSETQELLKQIPPTEDIQTSKDNSEYYAAFVWLFFIIIGFIAVRRALKEKGTTILGGSYDSKTDIAATSEKIQNLLKEYHVYHGRDLAFQDVLYEKVLNKRCPYYHYLLPDLKEKFLNRTKKFISSKTFLIKDTEPFIEMPILISATAVQLTFGLEKYLLPHYQYIRVYPKEYFAKGTLKLLAGHVYGNTITLSWSHFLVGNEEYRDGVNLGLHEMAHALYFQLVEADISRCKEFSSLFQHVLAEGMEVYQVKHTRPSALYTENAYRCLQEFWAESVELFFERPGELKRENADVYDLMKNILSQDPINKMLPLEV